MASLTSTNSNYCSEYNDAILLQNHPATLPLNISACVISTVLAVILIGSNVVIFTAFIKDHRLRSPSNILILSLAVTDFTTGLMVQPIIFTKEVLNLKKSKSLCLLEPYFIYAIAWSMGASLINIACLSLDRYVAVFYALRYTTIVTRNKAMAGAISANVLWSLLIIFPITRVLPFEVLVFSLMLVAAPCLIFTAFVNINLFVQARKHRIQIATVLRTQDRMARGNTSDIDVLRSRKRSSAVAYIAFLVIACYVPECVNIGLKESKTGDQVVIELMFGLVNCFILFNGCINPLIYCWKDRRMRYVVRKILKWGKTAHVQQEWGPSYW